uniref:UBC core domain-containing protein n=1 Tax=viral metagenome TaxID=1070528 RepID=A0A6C0JVB3_9ZZZZ
MSAIQRVNRELRELHKDPPSLWTAIPHDDNILCWDGVIYNIPGSRHSNKVYKIRIEIPDNYPFQPPRILIIDRINSKYIHNNRVCMDILSICWSPALTIDSVITGLCSLLSGEEDEQVTMLGKRMRQVSM